MRQPVHIGCSGANRCAAAKGARIAVSHVVDQEPEDVGPLPGALAQRIEFRLRRRDIFRVHQRGLHALAGALGLGKHGLRHRAGAAGQQQRAAHRESARRLLQTLHDIRSLPGAWTPREVRIWCYAAGST